MPYLFADRETNPHATLPFNIVEYDFPESFRVYGTERCFIMHYHLPLEILAVRGGCLNVSVDTKQYTLKKGDILLINPYGLHEGQCVNQEQGVDYFCLTTQLSSLFSYPKSVLYETAMTLQDGTMRLDEYYPAGSSEAEAMFPVFERMLLLYHEKSPANESEVLSLVYSVFRILFENHLHPAKECRSFRRNQDFMRKMSDYIEEHFSENLTTRAAAGDFFMNPSQFCRMFRRCFGMSFTNYLCQYRVTYASKAYAGQDMPISEIAYSVGFNDYCYFSKSFKKYIGISPVQYFKRKKITE